MDQGFRRGFTRAEKMTGPSEQSGASAQRTTSRDIGIQNPQQSDLTQVLRRPVEITPRKRTWGLYDFTS